MELIAEFNPKILENYSANKQGQIIGEFVSKLSKRIILNRKQYIRVYIEEVENTNKKEINEMIGQSIKKLRKSANMTQEELGKRLGCTHANISDIEHGKTKLTAENLLLMQVIFHKEIKDIKERK